MAVQNMANIQPCTMRIAFVVGCMCVVTIEEHWPCRLPEITYPFESKESMSLVHKQNEEQTQGFVKNTVDKL